MDLPIEAVKIVQEYVIEKQPVAMANSLSQMSEIDLSFSGMDQSFPPGWTSI